MKFLYLSCPAHLETICRKWHLADYAGCFRSTESDPRGVGRRRSTRNEPGKECFMLDIIMLALGLGFFALAIGYGYACERL